MYQELISKGTLGAKENLLPKGTQEANDKLATKRDLGICISKLPKKTYTTLTLELELLSRVALS